MGAWLLAALVGTGAWADDGAEDAEWDIEQSWGPTHDVELTLQEGTWMSVSVAGDTVVFDLLGDLWTVPLQGGVAHRLTEGTAWDSEPRFDASGERIAFVSDAGGNEQIWVMNADGTDAEQFTDEEVARVTDPVWDPSGSWILARRRTIDTRSIGVTEVWQYHEDGGAGVQLTTLGQHPHAGEITVADDRFVYFSSRSGRFTYDSDPMGYLWRIVRLDRRTGAQVPIVQDVGSAARPLVSPDGGTLVFVSRDKHQTVLERLDLASGDRRVIADWLDHDQMEGFALHGVYPAMDWTDDGDLVLWAQGKLWRLTLDGERTPIPFTAAGAWTLHDVPRWQRAIPDEVTARVIRWPTWHADGRVAFSALGRLWVRQVDGTVEQVSEGTGYAPAWSPDGKSLAWTSWSDEDGGRLHITRGKRTETLPLRGQLVNPAWSADSERLVVLRGSGGRVSPDLGSENWFEIALVSRQGRDWVASTVTTTGNRGAASRPPRLFLHDDRVWFMEDRAAEPRHPTDSVLVSVREDGTDKRTHLVFDGAEEIVPSPDFSRVAYKQDHQVRVTALPHWHAEVVVGSALPDVRITDVVGDWVDWTPDGTHVTWTEGPTLKRVPVAELFVEEEEAEEEDGEDGEDSEEGEDSEDESPFADVIESFPVALTLPRARPDTTLALVGARVVTMNDSEVLEDATVLIEGDRIVAVGTDVAIPDGAEVIDCAGKTIIPGLIDVHAHLHYASGGVLPEQEWRYLVNLDFGVTTVHDPSASTDTVFTQAEMVEAGLMAGPRVYSTGYILYGALANQGAKTPDIDAARNHIRRLKTLGAQSVKVYQQSQRDRRQWYAKVCVEEEILCIPEGGGDLWMNMGMLADGYHAIEHSLPNAPVYEDVLSFYAATVTPETAGTAYTQTLLVAYGGLSGESLFYQEHSPLDDERMLRNYPARLLASTAWRRRVHNASGVWNHQATAADGAELARRGVLVTLGAHGQLQGVGVHWELWAMAGPGAMTPHEALRGATLHGAMYIGIDDQLGSIEAGKLADLVVLNSNPLEDIHHSTDIDFTVKNGEVWR